MTAIGQRLRDLDNRVLKTDRRAAELRTAAGWRKMASRWRAMAIAAAALLASVFIAELFAGGSYGGLVVLGGVLAFQAGQLKAEDDRLNGRGFMNQRRPPGV